MAKDFESLKQQALVIKNEVEDGANNTERVGGMLEDIVESMKLGTCEFNVSSFYPTSGISGGNKYTLETAIAQVPAELRTAGLKVSFLNSAGKPESWKYQGGSWAVANFIQESAGGNKILTWVTDAATTRKQVSANERKAGMQISYKPDDEDWVNEQFVGTSFTDTEWEKDSNWKEIANAKNIYECKDLAANNYTSCPLTIYEDLLSSATSGGWPYVIIGYQYISAIALRFLFERSNEYPATGYFYAEVYCADDIEGSNEEQIINANSSDGTFLNGDICVLVKPYVKILVKARSSSVVISTLSQTLDIEQIGNFGISRFRKIISSLSAISGTNLLTLTDNTFGKTDKSWYISFFSNCNIKLKRGDNFCLSSRSSGYKILADSEPIIPAGSPTALISASYNIEEKNLYVYVNGIQYRKYENYVDTNDTPFVLEIGRGYTTTEFLAAISVDDNYHAESEIKEELSYYYGLNNRLPNYKSLWFGDFDRKGTSLKNGMQFTGNVTVRWFEIPRTDYIMSYPSYTINQRSDNAKNLYGYELKQISSAYTNTKSCIIEYIDVESIETLSINKDSQNSSNAFFLDKNYNVISYMSLGTEAGGNGYAEVNIPLGAKYCTACCGDKGVTVVKRRISMGVTEETPEWLKNRVRDKAIILPVEFNRSKYNNFGAPNNSDRNIYTITEYTDNTLTISEEELKQFYNTSDEITNYAWYDVIVKDADGDYHKETIAYSSTTKKLDRIKETDDADYVPVYFAACIQQDHPSDYNYRYMGKMMAQCISDVTNYKHLRQWNHGLNNASQFMATPFGLKPFANINDSKKPQERSFNCFLYQEGISFAPYASSGYDVKNIRMGVIFNSGSFNSGTSDNENYRICRLYGVCPVQHGYFQISVSSSRQKADSTGMNRIKVIVKNDNVVVHEQLLRGGGNEILSIPNNGWKWGYVEIEFVAVSSSMDYAMSLTQADFYELTGFEYYMYGNGIMNKNNIEYPCTSDFTRLSSILSCGDSWSHWTNNYLEGKADEKFLKKETQVEKLTLSLKGKNTTEFDNVVKVVLRRYDVNAAGRYRPNNQFFASIPKGSDVNTVAQLISEALNIDGWESSYENETVTFTANVADVTYQNYNGVLDFYCSTGEIEAIWEETTFQPAGDLIWFDTYKMWEYTDNLSMTGYLKKYSKVKELDIYGLGGQTSAYMFYLRLKEALNNGKRYTHAVVEYFTNDQTIDQTYIGACVEMLMSNGIKPIIMGSRSANEGHWKM